MKEVVEDNFWAFKRSLVGSVKALLKAPKTFIFIYTLTALPLSLLLFALSLFSHPLKAQIYDKEALALASPIIFETLHVREESRHDAMSLLQLKVLFFLPSYAFSLFATVTAVNATATAYSGEHARCDEAVTAVRETWKRPLATSIFVYVIMVGYLLLRSELLWVVAGSAPAKVVVEVSGVVLEVYLMAFMSVGMVVSVVEERFGWEAVVHGWRLTEGKRFCGWCLAGFLVVVSCVVQRSLVVLMDGRDLVFRWMMELMLSCLFGLIVLWSYAINTVFYLECRKGDPTRRDNALTV